MPFIPCQLATLARKPPAGPDWIFEPKYDGYRCQLHISDGVVRLYTRGGHDWTDRLAPSLRLPAIPADINAIIDGEICTLDADGRPDFALLTRSLFDGTAQLTFFGFDLLSSETVNIQNEPLTVRKQRLRQVIAALGAPTIRFVEHTGEAAELLDRLRAANWEGVMAKDANASYQPGMRTSAWRKLKFMQEADFIVAGWRPEPATGSVKSITLASIEEGRLVHRGSVGSGFADRERIAFAETFATLAVPAQHFAGASVCRVHWLELTLKATIAYLEFTSAGCVRCASFKRLGYVEH